MGWLWLDNAVWILYGLLILEFSGWWCLSSWFVFCGICLLVLRLVVVVWRVFASGRVCGFGVWVFDCLLLGVWFWVFAFGCGVV